MSLLKIRVERKSRHEPQCLDRKKRVTRQRTDEERGDVASCIFEF